MLSEAKHLPVKISFLAAPFMTAHPEHRVTFLGYTTLVSLIRTAAVNLQNVFPPAMIAIIRTNRSTSSVNAK
jgi:hypothetical protein